jgi:TolC family type I secretion outer membrane protein
MPHAILLLAAALGSTTPAIATAQTVGSNSNPTPSAVTGAVIGASLSSGTLMAPARPLGLLEAWQLAFDNDPTLRSARSAAVAERERLPQAKSQLLPSVQLSLSRFENDVNRQALDALSNPVSARSRYTSSNETLTARQTLFRMQQNIGVRQAKFQVNGTEAVLLREIQNLAVRVATSYFEWMQARDQAQLLASQGEFLQSRVIAASRSIAGGTGTRTDLDDAQARLDINKAQRLEAHQAIQAKRRQLQALVNRPVGDLVTLDATRLSLIQPNPDTAEQWVLMALDSSPEVLSAKARLDAAAEEINRTKAAHYPAIDAVVQWQRSRSEIVTQPQTGYTNTSVGVQLSMPIYNGGYVQSTVREAAAREQQLREALETIQLDLGVRIQVEFNAVTEGIARIQALEVAARSAEVALDSARKSVLAGTRTSLDVLNAQQLRVQALSDLSRARYALLLSRIRLKAFAGQVDEETFSQLSESLRSPLE